MLPRNPVLERTVKYLTIQNNKCDLSNIGYYDKLESIEVSRLDDQFPDIIAGNVSYIEYYVDSKRRKNRIVIDVPYIYMKIIGDFNINMFEFSQKVKTLVVEAGCAYDYDTKFTAFENHLKKYGKYLERTILLLSSHKFEWENGSYKLK
jgi:hypothetical protein